MKCSPMTRLQRDRLYGPWNRRTTLDAVRLLEGYPETWWVAGGHAIDAFTGFTDLTGRQPDLRLEIPRRDLPLLRQHLAGDLDVWLGSNGSLTPLTPADGNDLEDLPAESSRVWLRLNGAEPWDYDIALANGDPGWWHYRCDRRVRLRLADAVWSDREVSYLRPEIELLDRAAQRHQAADHIFEDVVGLLDSRAAGWLRTALELAHPNHPWLPTLNRGLGRTCSARRQKH